MPPIMSPGEVEHRPALDGRVAVAEIDAARFAEADGRHADDVEIGLCLQALIAADEAQHEGGGGRAAFQDPTHGLTPSVMALFRKSADDCSLPFPGHTYPA